MINLTGIGTVDYYDGVRYYSLRQALSCVALSRMLMLRRGIPANRSR